MPVLRRTLVGDSSLKELWSVCELSEPDGVVGVNSVDRSSGLSRLGCDAEESVSALCCEVEASVTYIKQHSQLE